MDVPVLLVDLFGRIPPLAHEAIDGVALDRLTVPPSSGANTIAWLLWHIGRVQDHQVSEFLGTDQRWTQDGWAERFGLEPDPMNTGYGHTAAEVLSVRPTGVDALLGYLDEVAAQTSAYLAGLVAGDLEKVVDENWDPPVTLGVRLVSIADDGLQHVGQAAYVRGLLSS